MTTPITIGVSACLLGEHVRYDGGHKHNRYITATLGRRFPLLPVVEEGRLGVINQYHDQLTPLIVPLTLLKHYVRKYDQQYLNQHVYLSPHPAELMLRNHV